MEDELMVAFIAVKRALHQASRDVDPGIFPVLHQLGVAGDQRQWQLAEALGLDASTVSRHVRALLTEGLIESKRDPHDGRATVLSISVTGREYLTERMAERRRDLEAGTRSFTDAERAELVRLLNKLAADLVRSKEQS